jgi:phosphoribosyl-AMP cyclohydrolase
MRTDCDQDAVWIKVEQVGAACHTGRKSCFYRKVESDAAGAKLVFVDDKRLFDPSAVYKQ